MRKQIIRAVLSIPSALVVLTGIGIIITGFQEQGGFASTLLDLLWNLSFGALFIVFAIWLEIEMFKMTDSIGSKAKH